MLFARTVWLCERVLSNKYYWRRLTNTTIHPYKDFPIDTTAATDTLLHTRYPASYYHPYLHCRNMVKRSAANISDSSSSTTTITDIAIDTTSATGVTSPRRSSRIKSKLQSPSPPTATVAATNDADNEMEVDGKEKATSPDKKVSTPKKRKTSKKTVVEEKGQLAEEKEKGTGVEVDEEAEATTSSPSSSKKKSKPQKKELPTPTDAATRGFKETVDNGLTILTWNVAGWRAAERKGALKALLKYKPDIVCLNEMKCDDMICTGLGNRLTMGLGATYHTKFCLPVTKKGYSGVAIYSKVKPLSVTKGIGISEHDQEGRVLTLEFDEFYLVAVYVPNSGEERLDYRTQEWDVAFRDYILGLKKPFIVTGDLNVARTEIDVHNPKSCAKSPGFKPEERESMEVLMKSENQFGRVMDVYRELYPEDQVNGYTYWSMRFNGKENNRGWRIDYFLVSESLWPKVVDMFVGDETSDGDDGKRVRMSDHAPICLHMRK